MIFKEIVTIIYVLSIGKLFLRKTVNSKMRTLFSRTGYKGLYSSDELFFSHFFLFFCTSN